MKKTTRITPLLLAVLSVCALFLGLICGVGQPAQADPLVLFAAPAAAGLADCSSWADACDLPTALTSAASGDQIWVQMGVHKPGAAGARGASFVLQPGVELYGGFYGDEQELAERDWVAYPTVLSGDIDNNDLTDANGVVTVSTNILGDNSYHVVAALGGLDQTARLDGFVITAGLANGASPNNYGGGMQAIDSSPTLANLIFSGNRASEGGGLHAIRSHPPLTDVIFSGNRGCNNGCGMQTAESSPRLDRVIFRNNQADHGGAMLNGNLSNPILTNVVFSGNTALESGGAMNNSTGSNPTVINATFNSNDAGRYGGAIFNYWSSLTLVNAILWGNVDISYYEISGINSTVDATYSDIRYPGGYPGTGNLNTDPLFMDADGPDGIPGNADDDLRPLPGSPVIDAGDNTLVPAGVAADLNGDPRFIDEPATADTGNGAPPVVDMGAFEAAFPLVTLEKEVSPGPFEPGDPIIFTLTLANTGLASATQVDLTDILPTFLIDRSVTWNGLTITDSGQLPAYVWQVQDLAPGASGVITIQGVLDTPLAAGDYTNTAVVGYQVGPVRIERGDHAGYTVSNLAPAITSTPVTTAVLGVLYTYEITTGDLNGDMAALTAPTLPAWLTLTDHGNGTATLSGTPTSADLGDHTVSLQAADPGGLTGAQDFNIAVESRVYLPLIIRPAP